MLKLEGLRVKTIKAGFAPCAKKDISRGKNGIEKVHFNQSR